ncbi:glycosyltransferase [Kiritimatiellaeota bacterium B1221]|nr:glycosyltransferase [Kiritimatiellaeota bacterium B1221]
MSYPSPSVSVVIPIRNAESYLPALLPRLCALAQVEEMILWDSMSSDRSVEIAETFEKVLLIPIKHFSHGGTRNRGIQEAQNERAVLMTQDALPADTPWPEKLISPLKETQVAYSFSRQIPHPNTGPVEAYFLKNRFPESSKRYENQGQALHQPGAVFCSNVSSALQREIALSHPFDPTLIMGEDQQFSRDVQQAGFAVVYTADSVVVHSHNFSLWQTFQPYFDSVIAFTQIFQSHGVSDSAKLGIKLLKDEFHYHRKHQPKVLFRFMAQQFVKVLATLSAHAAKIPPSKLCGNAV